MAARSRTGARKPSAREQREQELFDGLRGLLESHGRKVTVSKSLDGRGGDCLVRGEPRVIVSRRLPMSDRIEVLADVAAALELPLADVPEELRPVIGLARSGAAT